MWSTSTRWFDVAVVLAIFAVGNILFGHFEEHKPKWRRLLKVAIVVSIVVGLSATVGRYWGFGVLLVPIAGAAWVHLHWLPKHGINGWTGEPKDRYHELVGATRPRGGDGRDVA
jgi:hypothetical protein